MTDEDSDEVPEWVDDCDHINCGRGSNERSRLCGKCVPIMKVSEPDECPHCGTTFGV
jgi:hypothetical protein